MQCRPAGQAPTRAQASPARLCPSSWLHLGTGDCAGEGSLGANCLTGSQLPWNWLPCAGCGAAGGSPHNSPAELAQQGDGATWLGRERIAARGSAHGSFCAKPDSGSVRTALLQRPLPAPGYQCPCLPSTEQGLPGPLSLGHSTFRSLYKQPHERLLRSPPQAGSSIHQSCLLRISR